MMAYDLIIRNAKLEEHDKTVDIAISGSDISIIKTFIPDQGKNEIDANGYLVSPPFIDPHTHLDKCYLQPEENISGTLGEAIRIMDSHKQQILEHFVQRVDRALTLALKNGTLFVRTHVDVNPEIGIRSIEEMAKIRERWIGLVDLQIVAFPQDGLVNKRGMLQIMRDAMRSGASIVGGIPAIETSDMDSRKHIDQLFEIAVEYNADVDMHIDETDSPNSRTLEMLSDVTIASGWQQRVSAAHCCSLAAYDDKYAAQVIEKVAQAGINIITNPHVNLFLQGRGDSQPVRRGITRVKELLDAGVNVACGHDNLQDIFYPFGQGDMLEVAFITSLAAHLSGRDGIRIVGKMPRQNAARILGLKDYGIQVGSPANIVIIPEYNLVDILANRSPRYAVIRQGKLVCQTFQKTDYFSLPDN